MKVSNKEAAAFTGYGRIGEQNLARDLRATLAKCVEWAEAPDQCLLCHELLDKPDNDNGDGELLGHTLECPIAWAATQLDPGGTET